MTISCKICENSFSSYRRLCKHVRDAHRLTSQSYYDKHLRCDGEGVCQYCGSPTKFQTIVKGYRSSCKSCKSHKAKDYRLAQRQDPVKHNAFVSKVRVNQSRIWDERKHTGADKEIRKRIGQSIKATNSTLSDQELAMKYGWLNKLSHDEKQVWIQEVMLKTGSHAWWKKASAEEIQNLVVKRFATIAQVSKEFIKRAQDRPDDYMAYMDAVWYVTNDSYFKFKWMIDPDNKRGPDWHLDHIYSVKMGFVNNIDPQIIGSRHNLRIISKTQNLRKNIKCDITIEELLEKYHE